MDALFDRAALPPVPSVRPPRRAGTSPAPDSNRFRAAERQAGRRSVAMTLTEEHIRLLDLLVAEARISTTASGILRRDVIADLIVAEAARQGLTQGVKKTKARS